MSKLIDWADAVEIYGDLRRISQKILTALHCHAEPGDRVRRWRHAGPKGILFHYTGGQSGLKALKWGNHPGWGNTGSSWHVTIFDRKPDNVVGEMWDRLANKEIQEMFPVPTIINADWGMGTWHGNWTNNVTLGVENRNQGSSGKAIAINDKFMRNDKQIVDNNGDKIYGEGDIEVFGYEQFTQGQILANAWLGHLVQGYFKDELDPDWILTHQCVWASKSDTGSTSVFPIHQLRGNIAKHERPDVTNIGAANLPDLGHLAEDDSGWWDMVNNEVRCEIESGVVDWAKPNPGSEVESQELGDVEAMLYKIGFNTGVFGSGELQRTDRRRKAVRIFQKSTLAYKRRQNRRAEVLTTDGAVGPKTKTAIQTRIRELRLA